MQPIRMMRAPSSMVHRTGPMNFIEDRGAFTTAIRSGAYNRYLFADTQTGARDLVLVGTGAQIVDFFEREAMYGIENTIPELPSIFMGVTAHVARNRYRTLFAGNDAAMAGVSVANTLIRCVALKDWSTSKFVPQDSHALACGIGGCTASVGDVGDIGDLIATVYDMYKFIRNPGIAESNGKAGALFRVTFSPFPGEGMRRIGQRRVFFSRFSGQGMPNATADGNDFKRLFRL